MITQTYCVHQKCTIIRRVVGGIDTGETVQPVIAGQGDAVPATRQDHYETDRDRQPKKGKQNDDSSVAGEMLKTQQEILVTVQDLAATQRRIVLVQERLLALEEYRVYRRVVGESGSYLIISFNPISD